MKYHVGIVFVGIVFEISSRAKWSNKKGRVLIRVGLASLSLACVQPFLFSLFKIAIFIIIIEVEDFF